MSKKHQIKHLKHESTNLYNLKELRHIAINYAISCEKGYKGSFDDWFKGIFDEWRNIANS